MRDASRLVIALAVALTACGTASDQPPDVELTHQQRYSPLLTIRGQGRVCHSESQECQRWTELMLDCEQGTAQTCDAAEELRQRASGGKAATAAGSFDF